MGRVHRVYSTRPCTQPIYGPCTAVYTTVHGSGGPCTRPVHMARARPCTRAIHDREWPCTYTVVYGSCRRSCSSHARLYMRVLNTVVVHGSRLRPVYTSAYRVHGRPYTGREHVRVNGPCTRVQGHVYGHGHVLGPYTGHVNGGERPVNTGTVYTAVFTARVTAVEGRYTARPCTRPCSGHVRPCM